MNDKPIIKIQKNLSENNVPPGYANERLSLNMILDGRKKVKLCIV